MKKDLKKELKSKTNEELIKELRDLRLECTKLAIDMKSGKIENTNLLYRKKKDIARILTFLEQKSVVKENRKSASV